jgi:hypothetical protein
MDDVVFKQLEFVRYLTINEVEGLSEKNLDIIPEGFNNNLRWNLGHIYLVQEVLAFQICGEPIQLPEVFSRLFSKGTKPAEWNEELPTLELLLEMLVKQPNRIQKSFQNRLNEPVEKPFTTGSGLTLNTIAECLNYTLYHEGMHFNTITLLKRFSTKIN